MKFVAILMLLIGCATAERPYLYLQIEGDDTFVAGTVLGANAWSRLGYIAGVEHRPGPEIPVRITQSQGLIKMDSGDGFLAGITNADRNSIKLDSTLTGLKLQRVAAHEIGHVLFGMDHVNWLPSGHDAVMYYTLTAVVEPTQEDYDLVCKEAGDCL